ncbi:MAG TPA: ATP-grasp domain-containing protein [Candidatus Baltobacteraceae bacterium]|jgi:succinyl-CoA synthetase beta subunit
MARLLEHDALRILSEHGVTVPDFAVVLSPEEAAAATTRFGGTAVIKALIPTGGRGRAGAVRVARSVSEAQTIAADLLGKDVLRFRVDRLMVVRLIEAEWEVFVAFEADESDGMPSLVASPLGGIDLSEVRERDPGALIRRKLERAVGMPEYLAREIAEDLGFGATESNAFVPVLRAMYDVFVSYDATLLEINPLMVTAERSIIVPTAVLVVDEVALNRHPKLHDLIDPEATNAGRVRTPLEREMIAIDRRHGGPPLWFVEHDGDVALIVSGAGARNYALDVLHRKNKRPAAVLDVGRDQLLNKVREATAAVAARPGLRGIAACGEIDDFAPVDVQVGAFLQGLVDAGIDPRRTPVMLRFDGARIAEARAIAGSLPEIEFYDAQTPFEVAIERLVARSEAA